MVTYRVFQNNFFLMYLSILKENPERISFERQSFFERIIFLMYLSRDSVDNRKIKITKSAREARPEIFLGYLGGILGILSIFSMYLGRNLDVEREFIFHIPRPGFR